MDARLLLTGNSGSMQDRGYRVPRMLIPGTSVNRVRWNYLDEQGRSVQQDGYRYALRLEERAGPQICVVIAPRSI